MTNDNPLRDVLEEAVAAEERIPVEEGPETLVVTFKTRQEAEEALRVVNKALRDRKKSIYQGALVSRPEEGEEISVFDLHDTGLREIVKGSFSVAYDTTRDGFRLVWSTLGAGVFFFTGGWRLVRSVTRRSLALAGSTWTIPRRRRLDTFGSGGQVEPTGVTVEPGGSAVVILADHDTASQLATDLARSGGEIV